MASLTYRETQIQTRRVFCLFKYQWLKEKIKHKIAGVRVELSCPSFIVMTILESNLAKTSRHKEIFVFFDPIIHFWELSLRM